MNAEVLRRRAMPAHGNRPASLLVARSCPSSHVGRQLVVVEGYGPLALGGQR